MNQANGVIIRTAMVMLPSQGQLLNGRDVIVTRGIRMLCPSIEGRVTSDNVDSRETLCKLKANPPPLNTCASTARAKLRGMFRRRVPSRENVNGWVGGII